MAMYNLIIIGNGFDLAHDLKTSYRHFLETLNNNARNKPDLHEDILEDEMIEMLRRKFNTRNQKIYKNQIIQQLIDLGHLNNWSDIEYHYFKLINEVANHPDKSESTKRINRINEEFEQIKQYLKSYLLEEQKRFNKMDAIEYLFSELNNHKSVVLNFNYTDTVARYLENYKHIKQINIHGELDNENNPMIFGFAASDKESKVLTDENEEGYMRNIKKLNYLFTNNDSELKSLMNETTAFDVVILGHSCGISDRLILSEIFNHEKCKSITPLYYKNREGFLQTIINIDRITDDYSKNDKEERSFKKLVNYPQCISMIQHNSSDEETNEFKAFINKHEIHNDSRHDPPSVGVHFL